jgi:YidC/Oxa1 family membrane protein insertase
MAAIKSFFKVILYKPLFNILVFFIWAIPGHDVGTAIIILTVLIRILLLPSSANSIKAQKKLKDLQPEIDKIKEKYKDDQQAQAKATMDFYQANKINPFSSCLPLLIQLPILMVLYYVFQAGLSTDRFTELLYGFTPRPEYVNTIFLGMNISQPNIYLAIVTGLLQFWQSKQMTPSMPVNKDDKQNALQSALGKQMLYVMPVLTVFIAMKLPAALPIYWSVTTLFMIVQQHILLKNNKPDKKGITVSVKSKI